jgi:hypothetical protein
VADAAAAAGLSERDLAILRFEARWWSFEGSKEQAVMSQFGLSTTRYYQILNALIDRDEALEADPMLVKRLRRLRSARQRTRVARMLGVDP